MGFNSAFKGLILVGRFQERDYSGELGVGWRSLLKWTFSEFAMNV